MARVFVDSNIFIYAEIAEFEEHQKAVSKLDQVKTSLIVIDAVVMSEVHYKLGRLLGWEEAEKRCAGIMRSSFVVYEPLLRETMMRGFKLSKLYGTATNDAIIAQHCIDLGDKLLTDNTKDFKRIKEIEIISLR